MKLPTKLSRPPLIEALFELRFSSQIASVGDLLPGLLYSKLGQQYKLLQPLPVASVPLEIRISDPRLKYQPIHRMVGEKYQINVGEHVLSLSQQYPYEGWDNFKVHIDQLLNIIRETGLIQNIERFSIRFINILPTTQDKQLSLLNVNFEVAEKPISEIGLQIRTEIHNTSLFTVLQIVTNAEVVLKTEKLNGLLVDIDTIHPTNTDEFWLKRDVMIEEVHKTIKEIFFPLLRDETVNALGPTWEDAR